MDDIREGKAAFDKVVADLAEDLVPIVKSIEAATETTRHRYGSYMDAITRLSHGDRRMGTIVALALVKAGGHKQGVRDALKIVFP